MACTKCHVLGEYMFIYFVGRVLEQIQVISISFSLIAVPSLSYDRDVYLTDLCMVHHEQKLKTLLLVPVNHEKPCVWYLKTILVAENYEHKSKTT